MAAEYGRSLWDAREKEGNNGHEDLLVFGYSCKLFRDNDKALYLDKGKHLIPWMGDNSVMVDRYDVRGALYDLSEAEAGGGGDRWEGMTEEERAEEERCDYERYLALYHDEFQYQALQDEESKRLMAELGSDTYTYSQVAFNYDGQAMMGDMAAMSGEYAAEYQYLQGDEQQQEQSEGQDTGYMPEADEDAYIPPPELNVPQGMVVPETIKQNKIIVKTSKFIVTQGGQMEILIKTKQAGNPMFGFLSFDNALNAYYKHMVAMIKSGRYTPADEVEQERSRKESEGDQYLHPSLSAGIKPDLAPGTPTSALKPSADCAYSKLIHKIKEKQKNTTVVESRESPAPASPGVIATSTPIAEPSDTPRLEKKTESKTSSQTKVKKLVDYPSFNRTKEYESDSDEGSESLPSSSKGTTEYSTIKWPPPDLQMVIDKMASYIIKNGVEFETMVRSRDDPRFSFLKRDNEYFPYYRCKMRLYNEVYGDIFKDGGEEMSNVSSKDNRPGITGKKKKGNHRTLNRSKGMDKGSSLSNLVEGHNSSRKDKRGGSTTSSNSSRSSNSNTNSKQTSTICFSIKSREQDVNLDRHSTFPVESSSSDDEDLDEEEKEKRRLEREERRRKRKIKEKEERERREREEKERKEKEEREKEKEKAVEKTEESTDASGDNDDDMYDIFKYAQEMDKDVDIEEREKVLNEEGGKDGSQSAIDGTVQSEYKQQERRKKAAMFLSRLKKGSKEEENAQLVYGPQLPPEIAAQILNSASQSPRSSLGSTRHSTPSRSRSHSASPGPGVPMPPKEAPAPPPPPPPPPPAQSPPAPPSGLEMTEILIKNKAETNTNSTAKSDRTSIPETPANSETIEAVKCVPPKESSVLSGASEDGRRSQSLESRRSKSRPIETPHREKTRSRKKQRHGRSESRSPSSRRERKKRKRSRSRSRRHKKRRSRSRSPKSHKSSHKKKRRKHSSRHEREGRERKSKKSRRRSASSSSSESTSHSYSSSRSTSPSDNDVQVIESPGPSKRGSRASSVVSVGAGDISHLSLALATIAEECTSPPPLPPIPSSPVSGSLLSTVEEKPSNNDLIPDVAEVGEDLKEEKKPLFDPQNSAAMAKIAQGLRAKVHALLNKESKL